MRAIAEAVEHGDLGSLARLGLAPHESNKIKIEHREAGIHLDLRLKIKDVQKDEAAVAVEGRAAPAKEEREQPAYTDLKKRLKTNFAALVASCKGDTLPPAATVASFLADAERMVSFPGRGDEYYVAFIRGCRTLRAAVQDADAQACQEELAALGERMRACHKRYKQ